MSRCSRVVSRHLTSLHFLAAVKTSECYSTYPRYSDRPCHISILPAVVVRVGMLRRRVFDCGSRRGWKGTGSGFRSHAGPRRLQGLYFLISNADLRPQISPQTTQQSACSLQDKKSLGSLHGKQLQLVACRRVDAAASSVDLFLFVLGVGIHLSFGSWRSFPPGNAWVDKQSEGPVQVLKTQRFPFHPFWLAKLGLH